MLMFLASICFMLVVLLILSILVEKYLPDQIAAPIEKNIEEYAEKELENDLHLPSGSLKTELDRIFPHEK
jgi:hypothetical protein